MTLLDGLRVVELAGPFGSTTAHILASLGAAHARVQELDDDTLAGADVLIESRGLPPGDPRLIHATITCFGTHGPRAHYRGGELVAAAMSGVLRLVGDRDRAPVKEALDPCVFHAEACAAAAIMLAHCERGASGRGQHVDVSIQEVAASRLTNPVLLWQFDRKKLERSGGELRYGRAAVRCIWELRDGYVFHSLMSGRFGAPANAALAAWIAELTGDTTLRDVDWLAYDRSTLSPDVRERWQAVIAGFFRARTKREIADEGRRRGINASVLCEPSDVLEDRQLEARGFWSVREQAGRSVRVPASYVHVTQPPEQRPPRSRERGGRAALSGARVLDLSWALVGSLTTKALADHGACVVKVESSLRPCLSRVDRQIARSSSDSLEDKPWFAHMNTSKLSLRLDLKHTRVREVLDRLIAWADVIVENFSPGTLHKLGFDYDSLRRHKPELIMVSGSAYGQTGPLAQSWGVDGTSAALCSRTWLTGWPDRPPVLPSAVPYADALVPQFMITALCAALVRQQQTGAGCHIDAAMYEISVQQMTRALVASQLGAALSRAGNRDPAVWHQGVFPARGDDRWLAISLFDREDYNRLTTLFGGAWPDPEHAADAFDTQLAEHTRALDDFALMQRLQAAGIAAGVVQDIEDLLERDPQLRARPAWVALEHPILNTFEHQTTPHHLARTPARLTPAPLLGQHDAHVCRELLGLSAEHYAELVAAGVFT